MQTYNPNSLDTICAALCYAMGIEPPAQAAPANPTLCTYLDEALAGKKADRILMYNPDAIGEWIWRKYTNLCGKLPPYTGVEVPLCTIMPSVTPVCFGTMYTGAQPAVHGIQKYEKPIIRIDTIFDALVRAGKKAAIVAHTPCSMAKIYLERPIDYYIFDTFEEINACAADLIIKDEYDFLAVYNGNYDARMHKFGPESVEALAELRTNCEQFAFYNQLVARHWGAHNTLVGFAMDHGCHEIDGNCGSHGLDMPEDLNIVHLYRAYAAKQA